MPATEYKRCLKCGAPFTKPLGRSAKQWATMRFHAHRCAAEWNATQRSTHGATTKLGKSPEYQSWMAMKSRCLNPKANAYDQYGGRGITICDRWKYDYAAFLADMGPRPTGRSLDRIDTNGHYEPSNCRWATPLEQAHNRRPVPMPDQDAMIADTWLAGGITQAELGSRYGYSQARVSHVVKRRRRDLATRAGQIGATT